MLSDLFSSKKTTEIARLVAESKAQANQIYDLKTQDEAKAREIAQLRALDEAKAKESAESNKLIAEMQVREEFLAAIRSAMDC
ncbi:MAG: hypothetical protein Q8N25_03455 [Methylotenera sp.]|nr:hypothetical protein [Methylotenera sp.]MDP2153147.1 hypothetical protein [Methylotenera sp.]MDP3059803.1 hypothetical protein [Methylotenera sp.]